MARARWAMLAGLALSAGCAAAPFTLCYEDVPQRPWTNPDGTGLNFELLHRVERLTGERFVFVSRPWKRCMEEVKAGKVDAVVGPADGPERRAFGVFPLLSDGRSDPHAALYEDAIHVYLRQGGAASWDGHTLASPAHPVIVQSGYRAAELLAARGTPTYPVKTADEGLRMLVAGLADVAVLQGVAIHERVSTDPALAQAVRVAPAPFEVYSFHLMFSRQAYAAAPARVGAIWRAIAKVRASTEYQQLEAQQGSR